MTTPAWHADALCASPHVDPDWFFPDTTNPAATALALDVCAACPVRDACLTHALTAGERWGVWGGTTETQRRRLARLPSGGQRRPILHGAAGSGGDRAHRRRGEQPCRACLDAAAEYKRYRKARAGER